ncbi:hypothetical protein [Streptomyces sp. NPDC001292]|uniref:hypothetical protein n=1 Tax=Streptomyces sp. NPDC001292 TaxID=3364558 RepID=UPI0036C0F343
MENWLALRMCRSASVAGGLVRHLLLVAEFAEVGNAAVNLFHGGQDRLGVQAVGEGRRRGGRLTGSDQALLGGEPGTGLVEWHNKFLAILVDAEGVTGRDRHGGPVRGSQVGPDPHRRRDLDGGVDGERGGHRRQGAADDEAEGDAQDEGEGGMGHGDDTPCGEGHGVEPGEVRVRRATAVDSPVDGASTSSPRGWPVRQRSWRPPHQGPAWSPASACG